MTDFLLELRSEEIPARMQAKARDDLARLFKDHVVRLLGADLSDPSPKTLIEYETFSTPRRLALIARGLPETTEAVSEELKGPKASAPPQALEGFLRKTGLTRAQLTERDGVFYAITEKPGRATVDVLAEAIPAIVRAFPWPKSMRWGAASTSTESLRWVRPLHGIVALFGEAIVPCEIAGIVSGAATLGHRFHHPAAITIGSAADYVEKLRACHVLVDQDEREAIVRDRAAALAAEAGLVLVEDEGLVAENAGLTEWPVPLLGRFDAAFLDVPPEVIQLTARVNQKYFVCRDADGALANAFVCTANIAASDGGATIVEGNRKVLAARLSDARFFYETDLKVPLEAQADKLDRIVFHEKLGTVADKVERVAKLARWLVEEGIVTEPPSHKREGLGEGVSSTDAFSTSPPASGRGEALADMAERAARLAKADLVTGMVGEFPELQGLMGGYYAAKQGEPREVWEAVRDHYKPVGQGDEVPIVPVTVAVSLADKLDTIASLFAADQQPTGSKDPFALRRAALGALALMLRNGLRLSLGEAVGRALFNLGYQRGSAEVRSAFEMVSSALLANFDSATANRKIRELARDGTTFESVRPLLDVTEAHQAAIVAFFADRLKVQQREAGVRHDLIDAVFALGGEDDLVRLLARVRALQAFVGTADGANLLAGYKRAANILKKEGVALNSPLPPAGGAGGGLPVSPDTMVREEGASPPPAPPAGGRGEEPAEAALTVALDSAEPAAAAAVAREDFEDAMTALASLRAPIDAFFEQVIVNDADPAKRARRLALLARVRGAVHGVADFSRIEG